MLGTDAQGLRFEEVGGPRALLSLGRDVLQPLSPEAGGCRKWQTQLVFPVIRRREGLVFSHSYFCLERELSEGQED